LNSSSDSKQISSKEILARTGISRATLNNYIGLNLIPPPTVRKPKELGGPTKIGYFPEWVVERIERIRQLKSEGMRMSQIVMHFMDEEKEVLPAALESQPDLTYQWLEQIPFPAVLLNRSWEIIQSNHAAENLLLTERVRGIASEIKNKFFAPFCIRELMSGFTNWEDILTAHIRLAKRDLTEDSLAQIYRGSENHTEKEVRRLWRGAEPLDDRPFHHQTLVLKHVDGETKHCTLFSSALREGTLLLYVPIHMQLDRILEQLLGAVELSRNVLSQEGPSLVPLCVLAARLESDLHLRTTLPPADYLDLMNQIVLNSHQCFKEHGATPARSFQEGVVGFFWAADDSPHDYLFQALACSHSLRGMIGELDRKWKYKHAWSNTLRLNIGIHCGHEWAGAVSSALAFEFTVVGDTLMETVKLSEFSKGGAIWASKEVIENLSPSDRKRVEFGIRLGVYQERFVSPNIYSPVKELLSRDELEGRGLQPISNLAVTEVVDVFL
jgi:class 3 adenylate cyclase/DNA-binding transcriptional MerR regulator